MSRQEEALLKESSFGEVRTTGPYFSCSSRILYGWRPPRKVQECKTLLHAARTGPGNLYNGWLK